MCVPEDRSPDTEVSWPHQSAGQAHPPTDVTHVHTCTHAFISHQPPLSGIEVFIFETLYKQLS